MKTSAARQLLQPIRFREQVPRTPEPRSTMRAVACAHSSLSTTRFRAAELRIAAVLANGGQPNRHGSGTIQSQGSNWRLSSRSLARELCPNPTRIGHLMSSGRCPTGGSRRCSKPSSPRAFPNRPSSSPLARCRLRSTRGAVPRRLGPPRTSLREEDRATPHPRCLQSSNQPSRACSFSTGCPQLVDCELAPFRSSTRLGL